MFIMFTYNYKMKIVVMIASVTMLEGSDMNDNNGMKLLYAPWRSRYFSIGTTKAANPNKECPFCTKFVDDEQKNKEHLILATFKTCGVMLNLHPYNAGHLLVIPYKHTPHLNELSRDERSEMMEVANVSMRIVEDVFKCDGMNMGYNKGKASGGSVQDHLHLHILPRHIGDTNFLVALANTKAIAFDMNQIYDTLEPHFKNIEL